MEQINGEGVWEKQTDGIWSGLTDNYIRVYTKSNKDLTNKLLPVKLTEVRGDGVWGERVNIRTNGL